MIKKNVLVMIDPDTIDYYINKLDQVINKIVYINKMVNDEIEVEKPF